MSAPNGHPQSPQELAADQRHRAQVERERAAAAIDERDVREHDRRSEQADYLRSKLEDQIESTEEADG